MTFPTISAPHVDWAGDWQWVGYETDTVTDRVPPPHTFQDWIVTAFMFAAVVALFLIVARIGYWWRADVMGIFGFLEPRQSDSRSDADLRDRR